MFRMNKCAETGMGNRRQRQAGALRHRIPKPLLAAICCALASVVAQVPPEVQIRSAAWFPPDLVISTDANLVELVATVRDRRDHPIGGLHATDFEVLDNGQPREITFFSEKRAQPAGSAAPALAAKPSGAASPSVPPPEPRSIALFFDDAHASMLGVRKSAEGAERLIANTLAPSDLVGIFTSSGTVTVDFTSDRNLLLAALARMEAHPLSGVHATTMCPRLGPSEAYIIAQHLDLDIENAAVEEAVSCNCPVVSPGCTSAQREIVRSTAWNVWQQYEYQSTTALDAFLIVIRHLAAAPGERVLILMSPGFPTGGMEDRTSALTDAALRANIRIGAVNSEGLVTDRLLARKLFVLSGFMADAAKSTGGKYLHDTNDWAGSLRALVAVPEVSYVLGFSPPGDPDGKYHPLKTRVRGNTGYRVDSRTGYYAAAGASERETAQQRIDRIAMSGADIKDFPVTLHVQQESQAGLNVTIAVEAAGLQFPEKEGRRVQELTFLTVLEDAEGNFVAGKQSVMDMVLTPETLTKLQREGVRAAVAFPVPQRGSYRVRAVVREVVQNRVWASGVPIEVR
jgi:VWFA-related protein